MRKAITALFRFVVRVFFRRIEIVGIERIPADGPVLFAVNHPNGLVDPLFLLCFAPRPVSFLAKAPLFGYPIIGYLIRVLDAIPVYRKQDNTSGSNEMTFERARTILQRGGAIAIFPEGTTHDDPQLRELKTGAARIALGAQLPSTFIGPVGIYYTAKHLFRSSVLVVFGEPIEVKPVELDDRGEPPPKEVEQLTAEIEKGLDALTLQADSHAALDLIGRAEDIFTADEDQPLAEELELRRRFIGGYHYLRDRDPQRLEKLQSSIVQFESELRRAKIDVHELRPDLDASRLFRVLVLLPLALVGAVVHYPTYRLVGLLARRFSKGERVLVATVKFLGALALYPITYIVLAALAGWVVGWEWGVFTLIALPLLGYTALRVFEDIDDMIGDVRALLHRVLRKRGYARLQAQRRAIRDEIGDVAREMDGDRLG
jgi:1-acyl-sn-glycerol-3-phosphate acyltransferase